MNLYDWQLDNGHTRIVGQAFGKTPADVICEVAAKWSGSWTLSVREMGARRKGFIFEARV